jgi:hypothetical protein
MIRVVAMNCLIGLRLLINIELLWRSRSGSFKDWAVGVGGFVCRLHSPGKDTVGHNSECLWYVWEICIQHVSAETGHRQVIQNLVALTTWLQVFVHPGCELAAKWGMLYSSDGCHLASEKRASRAAVGVRREGMWDEDVSVIVERKFLNRRMACS